MLLDKEMWLSKEEKIKTKENILLINTEILKIFTALENNPVNRIYVDSKINRIIKNAINIRAYTNIKGMEGNKNER